MKNKKNFKGLYRCHGCIQGIHITYTSTSGETSGGSTLADHIILPRWSNINNG